MSRMHNPPHPGEVLREWLPEGMTVTSAAKELQVSRVTLSKVLNGNGGRVWMGMQTQFDLWQAGQQPSLNIKPLERLAA